MGRLWRNARGGIRDDLGGGKTCWGLGFGQHSRSSARNLVGGKENRKGGSPNKNNQTKYMCQGRSERPLSRGNIPYHLLNPLKMKREYKRRLDEKTRNLPIINHRVLVWGEKEERG